MSIAIPPRDASEWWRAAASRWKSFMVASDAADDAVGVGEGSSADVVASGLSSSPAQVSRLDHHSMSNSELPSSPSQRSQTAVDDAFQGPESPHAQQICQTPGSSRGSAKQSR